MLVGEGVMTTLSAMERFQLPGWALMSANNLAAWTPPPGVRDVLIAADRGAPGEAAAARLGDRLLRLGIGVVVRTPAAPFSDWNEVARAMGKEGARALGGRRSDGMFPPRARRPSP